MAYANDAIDWKQFRVLGVLPIKLARGSALQFVRRVMEIERNHDGG
jgi:hypothetical protein